MKSLLCLSAAVALAISSTSCLHDKTEDHSQWRAENVEYVTRCEAMTENGVKVYEKVIPTWSPSTFVLIHWHNDRSLTANNLTPLDNSTVWVKYRLRNIQDTVVESSYKRTSPADSIYQTRPLNNVTGFWAALTQMHVGDSVTAVIPAEAGYGSTSSGSLLPYSTLIFDIKLQKIVAFETPRQQ